MKRILALSLAILLAFPLSAFCQDDPAPSLKVTVIEIIGEVDFHSNHKDLENEDLWQEVQVGTEINQGGLLITYLDSSLKLRFGDNSVVDVFKNSEIIIDQFFYDKSTNEIVTDLRLTTGNIEVEVLESTTNTDMRVSTPNATASVTGTGFRAGHSRGFGSSFGVRHGSVRVGNRSGGKRDVGKGEKTNGSLASSMELALFEALIGDGTSRTDAEEGAALTEIGTTVSVLPGDFENNPYTDSIRANEGINVGDENTNFCCPPPDLPQTE